MMYNCHLGNIIRRHAPSATIHFDGEGNAWKDSDGPRDLIIMTSSAVAKVT